MILGRFSNDNHPCFLKTHIFFVKMWGVGHAWVTCVLVSSNMQNEWRCTLCPISIASLSLFGMGIYAIKKKRLPDSLIFITETGCTSTLMSKQSWDWLKTKTHKDCHINDFLTPITSKMSSEERNDHFFIFYHILMCVLEVLMMDTSCLHSRTIIVWILWTKICSKLPSISIWNPHIYIYV